MKCHSWLVVFFMSFAVTSTVHAQPGAGVAENFGKRGMLSGGIICWDGTTGTHGKDCVSGGSYSSYPKRRQYVRVTTGTCRTTGGCTTSTLAETTTNKINYWSASFANGSTQCWQVDFTTPENYPGTTLTAGIEWLPGTGTTTGVVLWTVAMGAFRDGTALDTALGSTVNVTDTWIGTVTMQFAPESGAITPAGTPVGGDHLWVEVCRVGGDASDTLDGTALLSGLYLTLDIDKVSTED